MSNKYLTNFTYPMTNNIDYQKLETYLATLSVKNAAYVRKIVENTIYISTNAMINMIRDQFRKFKETTPLYNLYIPGDKIGSDHYILLQLQDELHPVQIIYKNYEKLTNNYPIVMMDDCIYSGCHVCSHIDNLRYDYGCENEFVIFVAVLSTTNVQVLSDSYFNAKIMAGMTLDYLLPENMFGDYSEKYFYENFACEFGNILPLFFEHKIANEFGTYQFYHQIVDKPVLREKINAITSKDIDQLVEKLGQ